MTAPVAVGGRHEPRRARTSPASGGTAAALRLYVLRHGEPAQTRTFYGHSDVELSARGRKQIEGQVAALCGARIVAVHGSDLLRTRLGAEAIAAAHGVEARLDPALREMHLGDLEGVSFADALTRFPELASRSYRDMLEYRMPGGGESVRDVADRVLPRVEALVGAHALRVAASRPPAVVVYAHNTVARVLLARAVGLGPGGYGRFAQGFGAINRIDFDPFDDPAEIWVGATLAFSNRSPDAHGDGTRG